MGKWGPDRKQGAVAFSFDNMGEAAELESGRWQQNRVVGLHRSVLETLPFLLQTLEEFKLKATFFLEAWNADHYPDAVRSIAAAGHEIGCHGYRHETWFTLGEEQQKAVLQKAHDAFARVGVRPLGFRPPGGISSAATESFAQQLGFTYISPVGGRAGTRSGLGVIPTDVPASDVCYYDPAFSPYRHPRVTSKEPSEAFVEGFRLTLDDLAESGECRAPICHVTTELDTQAKKDAFRKAVELCVADDRLWKPTMGEAAAWMLSHAGDFPFERLRGFEPDWDPRKIVNPTGSNTFHPADAGR